MNYNLSAFVFLLLCCHALLINGQYWNGDIRLVGGSYQWEGRVEIYLSGTWGTITDSMWSSDDAQVVCRKLGYFKPGAVQYSDAYFGEGSGPIHLDRVVCEGTEYNLTDCETGLSNGETGHSQDVGVKCQTISESYREGDIRLVEGQYNWEGRVEIYVSGTWSTIYDNSWINSDAEVACRQLGHLTEGAAARCCAHYGQGSGSILIGQVSCAGSESRVTDCSYLNSSSSDHSNDVGVQCQPGGNYREGDIRLVGGSYSWEGRVEIYLFGEWGTITHDSTNNIDAQVVCRQLGYDTRYGYVDSSLYSAYFGEGTGPIHMNNLGCSGTEYRLKDCSYSEGSDRHSQDWSITCNNDGPQSGEVRLYNYYISPNYYAGRVEVYLSEEWGTVSDDSWALEDGEVVCRQLGFEINSTVISLAGSYITTYRGSAPVHMSNVQCSGSESRLIDCPHSSGGSGSDARLTCQYSNDRCRVGALRLVGGETEMEGRVEVCGDHVGRWGTVCDKQWTVTHTKVVCRNLGFSDSKGSYHESDDFGEGTIPILMDYVNCSGSEFTLWDCPHFTHSYGCSHSDDVGVHCQPVQCEDGEVRLVEGESETEGRVEVCINKRWGTVCYDGWSHEDATTVCRQLGYWEGYASYNIRDGHTPIHIRQVSCSGAEFRLLDCGYSTDTDTECYYYEDSGVSCSLALCADGEVRLVEGESEWEGRLEVCLSQRWGTVSSDGWSHTNTHVICSDLGYETITESETSYVPRPATDSMLIHMDSVQCSGGELTLLDCGYDSNTTNSRHAEDVGVKCRKSSCSDGDVRVVGGDSEREGRLEVCFSQRWGTVNGDGWSSVDTQVACRQLGYETSDISFSLSAHRNVLSTPIVMDNVACYGSEDKLIECNYHTDTSEDDHSEDIWINCDAGAEGTSSLENNGGSGQSSSSVVLLAILLCISILVIIAIVVVAFLVYNRLNKRNNNITRGTREDVHYGNPENEFKDTKVRVTTDNQKKPTMDGASGYDTTGGDDRPPATQQVLYEPITAEKDEPPPHYQPLSAATVQQSSGYQTRKDLGLTSKVTGGRERGKQPLPDKSAGKKKTGDEDIYDTCA